LFKYVAEEGERGARAPAAVHQDPQDEAVPADGAPQVVRRAVHLQLHLVAAPAIG
jgi:hypothetical protein